VHHAGLFQLKNISQKWGGTNYITVPPGPNSGGGRVPSAPPVIYATVCTHTLTTPNCISILSQRWSTTRCVCVEEIRQWMNANRLRLNEDKTLFIWLGIPHQLSEVQCQKISPRGVDIQISTEVTCLGVLPDRKLTFAPHVRRLSGKCFYHLSAGRQGHCQPADRAADHPADVVSFMYRNNRLSAAFPGQPLPAY